MFSSFVRDYDLCDEMKTMIFSTQSQSARINHSPSKNHSNHSSHLHLPIHQDRQQPIPQFRQRLGFVIPEIRFPMQIEWL
jgi:hypothetical protein